MTKKMWPEVTPDGIRQAREEQMMTDPPMIKSSLDRDESQPTNSIFRGLPKSMQANISREATPIESTSPPQPLGEVNPKRSLDYQPFKDSNEA